MGNKATTTAATSTTTSGSGEGKDGTHVVLMGDSIFDNGGYTRPHPGVSFQLQTAVDKEIPGGRVTMVAQDGAMAQGVERQVPRVPTDATHIFLSVGGNDGLGEMGILDRPAKTHKDVLTTMRGITKKFEERYTRVVDSIIELKKPLCVCTVYDPFFKFERPDARLPLGVDFTQEAAEAGLAMFNDIITRTAISRGLPIIDLRLVFNAPVDYANPIEPSHIGGAKMVTLMTKIVKTHPWSNKQTIIYK